MKKIIILLAIGIVVVFLVIKFGTFYMLNCSGDICAGPKKLEYVFARNSVLCAVVGGQYSSETNGWGGQIVNCDVKRGWICALRGGEFIDPHDSNASVGLDKLGLVAPGASHFCAKK